MIHVVLCDDHAVLRRGIRDTLTEATDIQVTGEAGGYSELREVLRTAACDVLLLDLNMPGTRGFSALVHLRAQHPELPIVMVSAREEPLVMRRALDHGALGFIPKSTDADTLGKALLRVLEGDRWVPEAVAGATPASRDEQDAAARVRELTPQQFHVLQMLGAGLLNKQMAFELAVSEATIKAHMTAILRKLGASNRTQAVLIAGRLAVDPDQVIPPDDEGN